MTKGKKLLLSLGVAVLIIAAFLGFVNFYITSQTKPSVQSAQTSQEITKMFTSEELKKYDGTNPNLPIYLALDGLVYDVTAGKEFYAPGGSYHYLAGKDSSTLLRVVGGDIIKKKYPVVGKFAE